MQESIIPQTVNDWLGLLTESLAVFGFVWAGFHYVVLAPMKKEQSTTAKSCTENGTEIKDLKSKMQASEFDRASLRQDIGRVEGVQTRNVQQLETIRQAAHQDQLELVERLARIETNMNLAAAMDRLGEKIVQALKEK